MFGWRKAGTTSPLLHLSRQEFELGFVFFGGEDEVGGEFVAAFGNEILDQGGFALSKKLLHFVGSDAWKIFRYFVSVSTVPEIERAIEALPKQEFERLAAWFAEKLEEAVDAAFDQAIRGGEFDAMADRALSDHAAGKSRP